MNPEQDPETDDLDQLCAQIGERWDNVQIFVSRNTGEEEGRTVTLTRGTGNWLARYGQIRLWLRAVEENDIRLRYDGDDD